MHQMPDFCVFSWPKPLDAALRALLAPFAGYYVSIIVNGSGKFITANVASVGKFVVPGELETNALHGHINDLPSRPAASFDLDIKQHSFLVPGIGSR
jgi:hypothetical protein